jgi:polysaccharide biosynthesis/export protein
MRMLFNLLQSIAIIIMLSSCYYNKKLVYLQDKNFKEGSPTKVDNLSKPYRLQVNDVVSVKVKSAADTHLADIFNITSQNINTSSAPGNLYMDGYSIDTQGRITLPILGAIVLRDLTLEVAQDSIQRRADKYLNQATVLLKLVSFKITVLGEVKNPGYHYVFNNQVSVLEALGLAGDLTTVGNRENVKLIRAVPGGSEVTMLDLTSGDLLHSPYFFLMPNDVLYVEPLRARSNRSNLEVWSVIFSAATTAILILGYIDNN